MSITFHPPGEAVNMAMEQLKTEKMVHPEAVFNPSAPGGLRREVTYRDGDFTRRLGNTAVEEQVVEAALDLLRVQGIIPQSAGYDEYAFKALRKEVKENFKGSWTSFTPTMERLVYALTSVKRPRCIVELGCFWGNTLAWFAGPCIGSRREYQAERIYGVDVNAKMLAKARENFTTLPDGDAIELIAEDARTALERIPGPIDILYLEAKDESPGGKPGLYLELLKQTYDKLPKGAWVLAHDVTDPDSREEIEIYLPWVHDKAHFVESICFDIDHCGLELSVK